MQLFPGNYRVSPNCSAKKALVLSIYRITGRELAMLNIQLGPIRQVLITKSATKEVQKDSANNSVAGVISAGTTEERLLAPELSPLTVDSFVSQMLVATEADQAAVDPLQPDAAATDHQGLLSLTLADSPFVSTEHILKIVATTASELGNVLLLQNGMAYINPVSYTHLRAHETDSYLVCRLLLEKKK